MSGHLGISSMVFTRENHHISPSTWLGDRLPSQYPKGILVGCLTRERHTSFTRLRTPPPLHAWLDPRSNLCSCSVSRLIARQGFMHPFSDNQRADPSGASDVININLLTCVSLQSSRTYPSVRSSRARYCQSRRWSTGSRWVPTPPHSAFPPRVMSK